MRVPPAATAFIDHASANGPDSDATRLFRPHAPLLQRHTEALDVREIGTLAASNRLLGSANPLLMMLQTLRAATPPGDVVELRSKLIDAFKAFDAACAAQQIAEFERHIAHYALCAAVDECIQLTPWGGTSNWAQQSLLIHFHGENWGGEKFFVLLNRIAAAPFKYPSLMELFYVCLALGFMGRFHLEGASGRQAAAELRAKLFQLLRQGRTEIDRTLSGQWRGLAINARRSQGFGRAGAVVAVLAMTCLGLYAACWWSLGAGVDALALDQLALRKLQVLAVATAPAARPRLAQLLRAEISRGQLEVRDLQLESVVTLLGANVFESASAVPSEAARSLIDKIADALAQVDGPVLVTGHTDNVALRSLRFASNWELSKERAANVAQWVTQRLSSQAGGLARVTAEGRGDTEPVALNDTSQGRTRNRRVEIVLKASDAPQ